MYFSNCSEVAIKQSASPLRTAFSRAYPYSTENSSRYTPMIVPFRLRLYENFFPYVNERLDYHSAGG